MAYLIGGNRPTIIKGTEEEFRKAVEANFQQLPTIKPSSTFGFAKRSVQASIPDVTRSAPLFNDPRYTSSTLSIPTDDRTLNGLYRFFSETDPIVGAALRINSELPLANLSLGQCGDSGVQQHYEDMWDRINGRKILQDITSEYNEIGDVTAFGAFDDEAYMWDQFAILNPDYVKIESTWINSKPLIKLIPDEALKRIVQTQSPRFIYEQLPPEIIRYVLFNQEIPLAPNNTFHLAHAKRPYEVRGRSVIKRILKILMLEDRFNQALFALATRHAVPITVVKLGDPQSVEEDHLVTFKEKEELKIMSFEDMWNNYTGQITKYNDKEVKDVSKYNLYTQSIDNMGRNVWNKIENILRHPTPDNIVSVQTPNAIIRSTEGHGFVRLNPDSLEVEEVTPKELKEDYSTVITMNKFDYATNNNKIFDNIELTEDVAYLIGLWTADGTINQLTGNKIAISNTDKGIQNYILNLPNKIKEIKETNVVSYNNDTVCTISWRKLKDSLIKYYDFKTNGKKTGIEKVPNEILFNDNLNIFGAFFAGVIDGDGFLFRESVDLGISTGASKIYHHFLSLSLLSKGIVSRVSSIKGKKSICYQLKINGKENLEKIYKLILPYLQHSKKAEFCKRNLKKLEISRENNWITNVFKVSDNVLFNLFPSVGDYKGGDYKEKPITKQSSRKYLSKKYIENYGLEGYEKSRLEKFYGVSVYNVKSVEKSSKYVYDLMLQDDPHYYLTAGEGWLLTHNTGYIPNEEEIDSVRDMFANLEMDPNFCYDEETECLTKDGWKKYNELNYDIEIACFDPENNSMIYDKPSYINIQDYKGEMYHFNSRSMDMKVTPNHRMFLERNNEWQIQLAENVKSNDKFRARIDKFDEGDELPKEIEIAGERVNTEAFFELVGWYLSEGSAWYNKKYNKYYYINISQYKEKGQKLLKELDKKIPWDLNKYEGNYRIGNTKLATYFVETFGVGSNNKKVPRWMLNAKSHLLKKLFFTWLEGDGTNWLKKDGDTFYEGYSASEQLIDAMQEVAIKLGYACRKRKSKNNYLIDENGIKQYKRKNGGDYYDGYFLQITKGYKMSFPTIGNESNVEHLPGISLDTVPMKGKRVDWEKINLNKLIEQSYGVLKPIEKALGVSTGTVCNQAIKIGFVPKIGGSGNVRGGKIFTPKHITKEYYEGKIWCPTVKTGIIITRRNGRVAIQGQSIFYHFGIDVQFYGSNGKMLPVGPELDRIYKLKFIGLGVHEQLLTGAGGAYAQAYINLEVQRQRYLNLQLKLEQLVHTGWFKVIADLCGFYRVRNAISGQGKTSNYQWGKVKGAEQLKQAFSSLRDFQDNKEFQEYIQKKALEQNKQVREYVYPKLDWGGMNASQDESLKNYIKWLVKERPHLVDDATLARLAKLDRDDQEKAYIDDLQRASNRMQEITKKGLLPFVSRGKGGAAGGMDFGGDIPVDMSGGLGEEPGLVGGAPDMPIGEGGPPDQASGDVPPTGMTASQYQKAKKEVNGQTYKDDLVILAENENLMKKKKYEDIALVKAINMQVN